MIYQVVICHQKPIFIIRCHKLSPVVFGWHQIYTISTLSSLDIYSLYLYLRQLMMVVTMMMKVMSTSSVGFQESYLTFDLDLEQLLPRYHN